HHRRLRLQPPPQARGRGRVASPAHQARRRVRDQGLDVRRPRNWPVRWRLAATSAGLTLIILLVFGAVIGKVATSRVRDDFNGEVRSAAQTLAAEIRIGYTPLGTVFEHPSLNDFVRSENASARIYDLGGNLLEHNHDASPLGP